MLPKVQVRPKGPPFGFFFGTMRLFSKIFEFYQRVPLCIFLRFSVCRKRWMSLNDLFLGFSALCDFFTKYFFGKKIFPNISNSCSLNIFEPKIWRRLGTFPSCFLFRLHWSVHFSYNSYNLKILQFLLSKFKILAQKLAKWYFYII